METNEAPVKRGPGKPKGLPPSGGRPKGAVNKSTAEIRALAQQYGPEAIQTLASIMRNEDNDPRARHASAKELLDRGYGKSMQPVEMSGPEGGALTVQNLDLKGLTGAELEAMHAMLAKAAGELPQDNDD